MEQTTAVKAVEAKDDLKKIAEANRAMVTAKKAESQGKKCPKCGVLNVGRTTCAVCHEKLYHPGTESKGAKSVVTEPKAKTVPKKKAKTKTTKKVEPKKASTEPFTKTESGKKRHNNQLLWNAFEKKPVWTTPELVKATGFDSVHVHYTLKKLANPNKTKVILNTRYDPKKQTWSRANK